MDDNIDIITYEPRFAAAWNRHVKSSRNGTFLFERGFMDYHADRFTDNSIIAVSKSSGEILALLPANREHQDGELHLVSHGGLTYGGWVVGDRMTASTMLKIFTASRQYLRARGFTKLVYKAIPNIFHRRRADEDQYALFINDARLSRVEAGSFIDLRSPLPWNKGKKHSLSKSLRANLIVEQSDDYETLIALTANVLEKHGVRPAHTASELRLLAGRFPDNIRLFLSHIPIEGDTKVCAAVLIFDAGAALHCQYIASTEAGRANGGVEAIMSHILGACCDGKDALSFGISTEQAGRYLNHGLQAQKEGFGARLVPHLHYEMLV